MSHTTPEEHFITIAYFNKWLNQLTEGEKETILYMLDEYRKIIIQETTQLSDNQTKQPIKQ